ncbi:MAG: tetratricopeptide repeat protein [Oscillatoriaceae cyanobacterium]
MTKWQLGIFGALLVSSAIVGLDDSAIAAQTKQRVPGSPLEMTEPDPLVPNPPKKGYLSPPESDRLRLALEELNIRAAAEFAAGNRRQAFNLWNRELRLRRYLGPMEEIAALTRVGAIAWTVEEITQVRVITGRLEAIELEACGVLSTRNQISGDNLWVSGQDSKSQTRLVSIDTPAQCDLKLLQALGKAYEVLRARAQAIRVYREILSDARRRGNVSDEEKTMQTIGQLHLELLEYREAATIYEELLTRTVARREREAEIAYVQELVFIYTQARQRRKAITMRERLIEYHRQNQDLRAIPELQIATASDHQAIGQPNEALAYLRQAYTLAWNQQQFYLARVALEQIAAIYFAAQKLDEALQVYEALLIVDRRAGNLYGMMDVYDQMGQIYKQRQQRDRALVAFQKGLELARQLKSREQYFTQQIQQLLNPPPTN